MGCKDFVKSQAKLWKNIGGSKLDLQLINYSGRKKKRKKIGVLFTLQEWTCTGHKARVLIMQWQIILITTIIVIQISVFMSTEMHRKLTQQPVKLFPAKKNWNLHLPCEPGREPVVFIQGGAAADTSRPSITE